jgi:hypothetical protein
MGCAGVHLCMLLCWLPLPGACVLFCPLLSLAVSCLPVLVQVRGGGCSFAAGVSLVYALHMVGWVALGLALAAALPVAVPHVLCPVWGR